MTVLFLSSVLHARSDTGGFGPRFFHGEIEMTVLKVFELAIRVITDRVERLEKLIKMISGTFEDYNNAFQASYDWTSELEAKVFELEKRVKDLERNQHEHMA